MPRTSVFGFLTRISVQTTTRFCGAVGASRGPPWVFGARFTNYTCPWMCLLRVHCVAGPLLHKGVYSTESVHRYGMTVVYER